MNTPKIDSITDHLNEIHKEGHFFVDIYHYLPSDDTDEDLYRYQIYYFLEKKDDDRYSSNNGIDFQHLSKPKNCLLIQFHLSTEQFNKTPISIYFIDELADQYNLIDYLLKINSKKRKKYTKYKRKKNRFLDIQSLLLILTELETDLNLFQLSKYLFFPPNEIDGIYLFKQFMFFYSKKDYPHEDSIDRTYKKTDIKRVVQRDIYLQNLSKKMSATNQTNKTRKKITQSHLRL